MEVTLILILPLVGGYYYASRRITVSYETAREDGHRLYFRSANYGIFLFLVAALVRSVITYFNDPSGFDLSHSFIDPYFSTFASGEQIFKTSLLAYVMGMAAWIPMNHFTDKKKALKNAIQESRDHFEILLYRAVETKSFVSVTMENRKVYIGLVITFPEPGVNNPCINLLPFASGYRDEARLLLHLTTFYDNVIKLVKKAGLPEGCRLRKIEDFEITLPKKLIHSANLFDPACSDLIETSHIPEEDKVNRVVVSKLEVDNLTIKQAITPDKDG